MERDQAPGTSFFILEYGEEVLDRSQQGPHLVFSRRKVCGWAARKGLIPEEVAQFPFYGFQPVRVANVLEPSVGYLGVETHRESANGERVLHGLLNMLGLLGE